MLQGHSTGASKKAHTQDMTPEATGCKRDADDEERRVEGATGKGAAVGLPQRIEPRGLCGRDAAEVMEELEDGLCLALEEAAGLASPLHLVTEVVPELEGGMSSALEEAAGSDGGGGSAGAASCAMIS